MINIDKIKAYIFCGCFFWTSALLPSNGAETPAPAEAGKNAVSSPTAAALTPDLRLIRRAEVLTAAKTATLEKYPDADEVLISEAVRVDYRPDGTYTQLNEAFLKILTERGRRNYLTISSYFTIPYQLPEDCRIPLLEIIKPDGRVVPVDVAKQSKITIDTSSMSANIYNPNDKIITVNITGLEIGDILHYCMYDNIRHPRAAGIFADFFPLEQMCPVLHKEITVNGAKSLPLQKIALRHPLQNTVKETRSAAPDGSPRYHWEIDNVPQAFPERNMPPFSNCCQSLFVSTAKNWEEVSAWYAKLCAPALAATNQEMRKEVDKIIAGATSPRQKIERIFTWVSQQIRYMGVTTEKTAPGYEPHKVKDTFTARHGVCRDKAALLVAMLRLADIEAYPVLIHTSAKKDPEVAQPFFNHAITAAKLNGEIILMDATDENTRELLPSYLNDKSYLVATEKGDPLRTSAITPAYANMMNIATTGDLDVHGNLQAETVLRFGGINDNAYRGYLSSVTPEERRRFFEGRIKEIYGDVQLTSWKMLPENPQNTAQPLVITLRYEAHNILTQGRNLTMLPLPFLGARVGTVNFVLGQTGLEKRRFPLVIGSTCGVSENIKINLPEELDKEVSMPVYKPIENAEIIWKRSLARVGKSLLGKNEFVLKVVEFSPKAYRQLKDDLKIIEYSQRKMPVFLQKHQKNESALAEEQADSLIVRDDSEIEWLSPTAWRERRIVRRKILTYAGLKDQSEIRINYNPAFESVKIESATVIADTGKTQNIGEHEINIMDQNWNNQAPRYPGGKTLVASLPGVGVGSIIEYRVLRENKGKPFFAFTRSFRDFDPVARRTVTLRAPDFSRFAVHSTHNIAFEETVDGARTWSIDNQPLVKNEEKLPPWNSFTPSLFISEKISWADYAKTVREKILAQTVKQPAAAAKSQKLLNGKLTLSAVRELVFWYAQNIRLAGPDFGDLPLKYLTPADRTLTDGYGNTTDRAVLLLTMLRPYNPEIFLVTELPQADNLPLPQIKLPNPRLFTKVLIRIKTEDRTIWLNDINQYDELGTTPSDGMMALNLQNGKWEPISVDTPFKRSDEIAYHVELLPEGNARMRISETVSGARYGVYKKMFAEMRPEQRRRHFQNELAAISQAARADGEYITDFSAYPGKISFAARVAHFAVEDGGFTYFSLPKTLDKLLNLRSARRDNPLLWRYNSPIKITTVMVLPSETRPLIFPGRFLWQSPIGKGTVECETLYGIRRAEGKNVLQITQNASMGAAYYVPALYPELLKIQSRLVHNSARAVLLANKKWLDLQDIVLPAARP